MTRMLFPVIESVHITGLAILWYSFAILIFVCLDWCSASAGIANRSGSETLDAGRHALMLTTGPLMLSAEPERGYANPAFAFKCPASCWP